MKKTSDQAGTSTGKTFWFMLLLPLLVGFDYGTKQAVSHMMPLGSETQLIPGWLSLYHTENPFIAMSIQVPFPAIVIGAVLMIGALLWTFWKLPSSEQARECSRAGERRSASGGARPREGKHRTGLDARKARASARIPAAALATVMAGGIGNLIDRLVDGRVTDFVRVYTNHETLAPWLVRWFGSSTWPIFNVADVCILAGAGLWLLHSATEKESEPGLGESEPIE